VTEAHPCSPHASDQGKGAPAKVAPRPGQCLRYLRGQSRGPSAGAERRLHRRSWDL